MTEENRTGYDAIFVGGGVIGLACAWRASRYGARVCVLERDHPASGATGVAAGMLAPVGEASWGEDALLSLNLESLARWSEFARELEEDAEAEIGFERLGALHVALDHDEAGELRRRWELHRRLGLESEWLPGSGCRELEPGLATAVRGGVHAPSEAAVDPRRLAAALLAALERRGGEVHRGAEVVGGTTNGDGWRLETARGESFDGTAVVLAAGCWSGAADWLPSGTTPAVRPVKGEILTLAGTEDPPCERIVAGERVYLVPRADGRLILGATTEERGFEATVTAGGVYELLREAYRMLPEIAELELLETSAGLRPATPDNSPLIGEAEVPGLLIATGHYRNGVLQAPITAESIAALLAGERPPVDLGPFSPLRFSERAAASASEAT